MRRHALALVCAVLAAVAASGCVATTPADLRPATVVVIGRSMPPEFGAAFQRGAVMRVADSGVEIGVIASVEATPSPVRIAAPGGGTVERPSPLYRDFRVTLTGSAKADSGGGYLFPGGRISVGQEALMTTKRITFTGSVLSIQPKGE